MIELRDAKIAVVGLGYVGLPLAVAFGKTRPVVGFDIRTSRISDLRNGFDSTLEVPADDLEAADITYSDDASDLRHANVYIVTTPTPIDQYNRPDLHALLAATDTIARHMQRDSVVIYESTVYPGATEEDCVPVLERVSGLRYNKDFFVGYSPERINPGDRIHRVETITKVTSGSTSEAAQFVDALYKSIITAGTHLAPSIKVAEAAKVIENTQRDVNIALINELAILFSRLNIDTEDVLNAAGTKWNFLPFRPGLVGGHCIGVDPYYLTHKAQAAGHNPEIILAGRRINDSMGPYVASQLVKQMNQIGVHTRTARVLILGLTFKENTPDLRNSKVVDILHELRAYGIDSDVHDPWVDPVEAKSELGVQMTVSPEVGVYDAVLIAVAHDVFREMGSAGITAFAKADNRVIFDLKYVLPKSQSTIRL